MLRFALHPAPLTVAGRLGRTRAEAPHAAKLLGSFEHPKVGRDSLIEAVELVALGVGQRGVGGDWTEQAGRECRVEPRMVELEPWDAFPCGQAGRFGELAELAAIDTRLEDVLLDCEVAVNGSTCAKNNRWPHAA
jgi:hypothetical protein